MRFGPNSLSVNSNTSLNEIYGFKSNVQKAKFYTVFPPTKDAFNTHNSIDKARHSRKRRALSQAFSDAALKSVEKYALANIQIFCGKLFPQPHNKSRPGEKRSPQWSVSQDIANWCNYLAFDIMGDLVFGKAFAMLERSENRFAVDLVGNAAHRHLIVRK